ncbi:Ribokinase/fructokinase [Fusarium oxysporum f. sp. vasinfectum]|nr:Ribokinase/fructokinase [Fusarium oxysporum f. sp. vasinfectum]KAK2927822.1 Ribokinase/fructokinase [Fusarium oxysporum f. sp. vasinfectum]
MPPKILAVIGALDADLIMVTSRIFDCGESVCANHYHEALGGKGANSAIAAYRTCQKSYPAGDTLPVDSLIVAAEQVTVGTGDDIQVEVIRAVGDDRYGQRFKA